MNDSAVATLPDEVIESEIATLSAQLDAAEHRLLTLVRELDRRQRHRDHGLASMAAWLGWRVGLGVVAAREKVRVARALGELPRIDAAFAKAEVSYSKVRAMTRIATPESEGRLLHMAKNASASQLETICRGVEQVTGQSPDGQARWVKVKRCRDGMVRVEARLRPDEAGLVLKAIEAAIEERPAESPVRVSAESSVPASAESPVRASAPAAREARPDGLVRVAEAFLAGQRPDGRPGAERHQLVVCVREDALVPGGVAAEVDGVGHVVPETLRRLACDASVTRVTVDPDGAPLDVGRKARVVPPAMRRALVARDRGCRFPGCTNQRWVDAHHLEHWADGGATRVDNLVLLCPTHHRLVHEGGFRVRGTARDPRFERPDGTPITPPVVADSPLPAATPPRAPPMLRPNYHWAIGAALPRVA